MEENENNTQNMKLLKFICPICGAEKQLPISKSIISEERTLTTISIQKNEVCEHHFQAFIDKNLKIRGYQKVDFEIATKKLLPKGDFIMKVIIIGDYAVGKTAITRRFIDNSFDEGYLPTVQLRISKKDLKLGDTNVKLIIWDVGGQVTHMSPYRDDFYEGAQSALIIVDRTRKKTLENAEMWLKDSKRTIAKKIPYILVGNKSDLEEDILIEDQELKNEADKLGLNYFVTSAKTGVNVNELFTNLANMFLESQGY
ncbi:MAG: GTP-binding protein [Promethearchaeota archaeon]|nr:MAG: GTP-binding protein [Candidatus Lokiarchaeota archaeon]